MSPPLPPSLPSSLCTISRLSSLPSKMTTSSRMEHQHSIQPGYPRHHHHSHQESQHHSHPSSDLSQQHSPKDSLPPLAYLSEIATSQKDAIATRRHDTAEGGGGGHYHRSSEGSIGHYRLQHNNEHSVGKMRDSGRLCNESHMQGDTYSSSSSGTSSPHEGMEGEKDNGLRERVFLFCWSRCGYGCCCCVVCLCVVCWLAMHREQCMACTTRLLKKKSTLG